MGQKLELGYGTKAHFEAAASLPAEVCFCTDTHKIEVYYSGAFYSYAPNLGPAPSPPDSVSAAASDAQALIGWAVNSGAATYNVYQSTGQAGPWTLAGTTAANTLNVTGLSDGTTYYFAVTALSQAGAEGPYGTVVSAAPSMTVPMMWFSDAQPRWATPRRRAVIGGEPPWEQAASPAASWLDAGAARWPAAARRRVEAIGEIPWAAVLSPPPPSTWSFVQSTSAQHTASASAQTLAFGSNVTSGDLLIVAVGMTASPGDTVTVTDSQSNTYTQVSTYASFSNASLGTEILSVWWTIAGSSGANTVTVTPSGIDALSIGIHEYTPPAGTVAVDKTANVTSTSAGPAASLVGVTAGAMIFAAYAQSDSNLASCTAGSGFTLRANILNGSGESGLGTEDKLNVAAGGQTVVFSLSASVNWGCISVSFKG